MTEPTNLDAMTDRVIRLRDAIKEADKKHKEKMAPFKEKLEEYENKLLAELTKLNVNKFGGAHGTVFKSHRNSATIADGSVFRDYVIQNEAWDLVDWRANPTAVGDHITEHHVPPPGVNFATIVTVNVRRS